MNHRWDMDACCIHCGLDGAEERHLRSIGVREPLTPCPVWDEFERARNERRYQSALVDEPGAYWD